MTATSPYLNRPKRSEAEARKSRGQRDYEADIARAPKYHDGSPRPSWDALDALARWSWERGDSIREQSQ